MAAGDSDASRKRRLTLFLIYGKRKSGKDFCAGVLRQVLDHRAGVEGSAVVRRISDPLKDEYAKLKGLTCAEELKTSGPMKEIYRKDMVDFGERIRQRDSGYFCRLATQNLPSQTRFLIISDCRRHSDVDYFRTTFDHVVTLHIVASDPVRTLRGFVFTPGIDDAGTECALDDFQEADATIDNSTPADEDESANRLKLAEFFDYLMASLHVAEKPTLPSLQANGHPVSMNG